MKNKTAFSFIELSIVLTIIAVLLSTSMPIATNVINNNRIKVTKERMEVIYQALGAFLASNGRLPCPASMQLAETNANYGKEIDCSTSGVANGAWRSNGNSNVIYGMIPVAALGLPAEMAEDGFSSKIAYVVITGYANKVSFGTLNTTTYVGNGSGATYNAGDGVADNNRIRIHKKTNSSYTRITANAVMLMISYGQNKKCAFNSNSTSQNSQSSDSEELFNCASNLDSSAGVASLYSYNYATNSFPFLASSFDNENFDDIIFYKTRNEIIADFNLYDLIYCSSDSSQTISYGSNYTFYWYGSAGANLNTKYGSIVQANALDLSSNPTTACPSTYRKGPTRPTKRCGRFGVWENEIISHCTS